MAPRIAIVGGGGSGAAILRSLTRAGVGQTTLFEARSAAAGATGLSGGLVRVYHTDPALSDLAADSVPALRRMGRELAVPVGYAQVGSLYLEPEHRLGRMRAEVDRLRGPGRWPLRVITPDEGRSRFPAFCWDGVGAAVYEEWAGYASPRQTTAALLELAVGGGAVVVERSPVLEILTRQDRVAGVRLASGTFAADVVVLAAGAWSGDLLPIPDPPRPRPAAPIRTKRIQYNFFRASARPDHPAFVDDTTGLYGRPHEPGVSLVGLALDEWDVPPEPTACDPHTVTAIRRTARQRIPCLADAEVTGGVNAFDAYTADGQALLGFHHQIAGLFLATGWNGGGFKMVLGIGRRVTTALREYLR